MEVFSIKGNWFVDLNMKFYGEDGWEEKQPASAVPFHENMEVDMVGRTEITAPFPIDKYLEHNRNVDKLVTKWVKAYEEYLQTETPIPSYEGPLPLNVFDCLKRCDVNVQLIEHLEAGLPSWITFFGLEELEVVDGKHRIRPRTKERIRYWFRSVCYRGANARRSDETKRLDVTPEDREMFYLYTS